MKHWKKRKYFFLSGCRPFSSYRSSQGIATTWNLLFFFAACSSIITCNRKVSAHKLFCLMEECEQVKRSYQDFWQLSCSYLCNSTSTASLRRWHEKLKRKLETRGKKPTDYSFWNNKTTFLIKEVSIHF